MTSDNFEHHVYGELPFQQVTINIFNIAKINAEVRGGRLARIHSFQETHGESYFDRLSGLRDLVLIMDESHRYRGTAGLRAINALRPVLGLELTATPFVEGQGGRLHFKNVVFEYSLARAIDDRFVKEPAVVTRENFVAAGMTRNAIDLLKLEDGVRLHESIMAELEAYACESGKPLVKPIMLVIARDTGHAGSLIRRIKSSAFFDGRYAHKVIQVDSSVNEDETIQRLLQVERADEPTEIVIHVNMLKEGWDVSNLFTIVPLRAAHAQTLIVQSVGRGLRLPYGERTGNPNIDRVAIVAHDRFQEFLDEARKPNSPFQLQSTLLKGEELRGPPKTIICPPIVEIMLGLAENVPGQVSGFEDEQALYGAASEDAVRAIYSAAYELMRGPNALPSLRLLRQPRAQEALCRAAADWLGPDAPDAELAPIVASVAALIERYAIDLPQIGSPTSDARAGFRQFKLDISDMNWPAPSEALWAAHLQGGKTERVSVPAIQVHAGRRIEDDIVDALLVFDDVPYGECADLLYNLAQQVVRHLSHYLARDDVVRVVRVHQQDIARMVHAQMQQNSWSETSGDAVPVVQGLAALKPGVLTTPFDEVPRDFLLAPPDVTKISRHLFIGFSRCLYGLQKFQSDPERRLAIILDREAIKWFKPVRGQILLFYRCPAGQREYQPDFIAETETHIHMLEVKALNQMNDPDVLAKRDAAVTWCVSASGHTRTHGGKPWSYALIPDRVITENMTIEGLVRRFGIV